MNTRTTPIEVRALRLTREQVTDLLGRYPRVSANESAMILDFLRTGRHLDVGLLTGDQKLKGNLDAFMDDHRQHFRLKLWEVSAVIGGIAAFLILLWLLWEAVR